MLGRGLFGITLANARGVMVGDDHDVLCGPVHFAQQADDGDEVGGGIGDDAGAPGFLGDGSRCREALGNVEGAGLVKGADLPEAGAGLGAGVVELRPVCGDILETGQDAVVVEQGDDEAPVPGYAGAVGLYALGLEVGVVGDGRRAV